MCIRDRYIKLIYKDMDCEQTGKVTRGKYFFFSFLIHIVYRINYFDIERPEFPSIQEFQKFFHFISFFFISILWNFFWYYQQRGYEKMLKCDLKAGENMLACTANRTTCWLTQQIGQRLINFLRNVGQHFSFIFSFANWTNRLSGLRPP